MLVNDDNGFKMLLDIYVRFFKCLQPVKVGILQFLENTDRTCVQYVLQQNPKIPVYFSVFSKHIIAEHAGEPTRALNDRDLAMIYAGLYSHGQIERDTQKKLSTVLDGLFKKEIPKDADNNLKNAVSNFKKAGCFGSLLGLRNIFWTMAVDKASDWGAYGDMFSQFVENSKGAIAGILGEVRTIGEERKDGKYGQLHDTCNIAINEICSIQKDLQQLTSQLTEMTAASLLANLPQLLIVETSFSSCKEEREYYENLHVVRYAGDCFAVMANRRQLLASWDDLERKMREAKSGSVGGARYAMYAPATHAAVPELEQCIAVLREVLLGLRAHFELRVNPAWQHANMETDPVKFAPDLFILANIIIEEDKVVTLEVVDLLEKFLALPIPTDCYKQQKLSEMARWKVRAAVLLYGHYAKTHCDGAMSKCAQRALEFANQYNVLEGQFLYTLCECRNSILYGQDKAAPIDAIAQIWQTMARNGFDFVNHVNFLAVYNYNITEYATDFQQLFAMYQRLSAPCEQAAAAANIPMQCEYATIMTALLYQNCGLYDQAFAILQTIDTRRIGDFGMEISCIKQYDIGAFLASVQGLPAMFVESIVAKPGWAWLETVQVVLSNMSQQCRENKIAGLIVALKHIENAPIDDESRDILGNKILHLVDATFLLFTGARLIAPYNGERALIAELMNMQCVKKYLAQLPQPSGIVDATLRHMVQQLNPSSEDQHQAPRKSPTP